MERLRPFDKLTAGFAQPDEDLELRHYPEAEGEKNGATGRVGNNDAAVVAAAS